MASIRSGLVTISGALREPVRGARVLGVCVALAGIWSCAVPESVRSVESVTTRPVGGSTGGMTPQALAAIELVNNYGIEFDESNRRRMNEALEREMGEYRVFGTDRSSPYVLKGTVLRFNEVGGGLFGGGAKLSLVVQYALFDGQGQRVYQRRLSSGAEPGESARVIDDNARQLAAQLRQYFSVAGGAPAAAVPPVAARPDPVPTPARASVAPSAAFAAPSAPRTAARASRPAVSVPPVEIQSLPHSGIDFGRYHALIIGNDRYLRLKPLRNASADARRLDTILRSQYAFETTLLVDASRQQILDSLARLRRSLGPRDNLLIYYAGHGTLDDKADEGYWLPVDADRDNPANWISNSSITTEIRAIRARHVLVVADSCFSGKLTRGIKPRLNSPGYLSRMVQRVSRTALTSGGLEPVLDGGESPSTRSLLRRCSRPCSPTRAWSIPRN
ncbi:MAG: caspase family protein [Burkholderiaceae bacterium]